MRKTSNNKQLAAILLLASMLIQNNQTLAADSIFSRGLDLIRNVTSSEESDSVLSELGSEEIAAGLKEALRVGSERVVEQLGKNNGFNTDPKIRIPLPDQLDRVRSALTRVGMASTFDDLEIRLNRAAEEATPIAKGLFIDAVNDLTLEDVNSIFRGEEDAATQYFKSRMSPQLNQEMQPLIQNSLAQVGAVQIFDQVMERYNALPFMPEVDLDLNDYVVQKAMNGVFFYMAQEEAAIRENPLERSTDLLKRVFSVQ